jgi:hypothetical protein
MRVSLLLAGVSMAALPLSGHALEAVAQMPSQRVIPPNKTLLEARVKAQEKRSTDYAAWATRLKDQLDHIDDCRDAGKIYSPDATEADANGCVPVACACGSSETLLETKTEPCPAPYSGTIIYERSGTQYKDAAGKVVSTTYAPWQEKTRSCQRQDTETETKEEPCPSPEVGTIKYRRETRKTYDEAGRLISSSSSVWQELSRSCLVQRHLKWTFVSKIWCQPPDIAFYGFEPTCYRIGAIEGALCENAGSGCFRVQEACGAGYRNVGVLECQ